MKVLLSIYVICVSSLSFGQYALVWADEFDDNELNLNKWSYDLGQGDWGWGNNELQFYTNNAANINVDTGYLHIIAKSQLFAGANYTSAKIKTKDLYEFTYGRVEARIKIPYGQGMWPAFWMLGANIDDVSWPYCGEIDVMEHINNETVIHGTHHYDNNGHVYSGNSVVCDASEFQTYSIEWSPNSIKWYLNGIMYFQTSIGSSAVSKEEFHSPFYLILNLAVGGNWPGNPDGSTQFPATMVVDYVRVYQNEFTLVNENSMDNDFKVYPNPANDLLTISKNQFDANYSIFNIHGQEIVSVLNKNPTIDVSYLDEGVYYIKIQKSDGSYSTSVFVKQ